VQGGPATHPFARTDDHRRTPGRALAQTGLASPSRQHSSDVQVLSTRHPSRVHETATPGPAPHPARLAFKGIGHRPFRNRSSCLGHPGDWLSGVAVESYGSICCSTVQDANRVNLAGKTWPSRRAGYHAIEPDECSRGGLDDTSRRLLVYWRGVVSHLVAPIQAGKGPACGPETAAPRL